MTYCCMALPVSNYLLCTLYMKCALLKFFYQKCGKSKDSSSGVNSYGCICFGGYNKLDQLQKIIRFHKYDQTTAS